jgi:beta-glucanase (GH16 family)
MRSRAPWLRAILAGCLLVLAATGAGRLKSVLLADKWELVWSADFTGAANASLNASQWSYETGYGIFGNNDIETMTNSPVNAHLDGTGGADITAVRQGTAWTSARIKSVPAFEPPPDSEMEFTASIMQPGPSGGLGYWPAFWLLGEGTWPAHGEIDIMEDVNALSEHSAALHCGNLVQRNADGTLGPCHEQYGLSSHLLPCSQCQAGYHTYSVIVDRRNLADQEIRWYLDGRQFFAVRESQVGAAAWNEAIESGLQIIFDVAIGGTYPDDTCHCQTPSGATSPSGTMHIRDVGVYVQVF